MLALSCGCQLLSPEDGLLYARALNQLKQAGIEGAEHFGAITLLWLISSSLMILPLALFGATGAMGTGAFSCLSNEDWCTTVRNLGRS
ncbi:MAG: hypothetical protein NT158_11680 [Cyanobacteria bacterium]|nr:hypothetical protein [Cyanobacteriota bacterium]